MKLLGLLSFLLVLLLSLASYVSSTPKVAVYWGQNSAGSTYPSDSALWEQGLASYCQDSTYDIIILSFVDLFPTAPGSLYPGLNFADHCGDYYDSSDPYLLMCSQIGSDIQYCQSQGKIIELSFGGAAGSYGFSSDTQAQQFAGMVWNMFMAGTANVPRPFGSAIIDGVDLDIEGGSTTSYAAFINELRTYYATDTSRTFYISGAPQCVYPDAYLGPTGTTALQTAHFDFVFVQFYNNYCGLQNFGTSNWNFGTWANWASSISVNPNVQVFIGAPASSSAAGSGYISISSMQNVISQTMSQYPAQFGGIMLWDAGQAADNNNYGGAIASYMKGTSAGTTGTPATTAVHTTAVHTTAVHTNAQLTTAPVSTAPATTAAPATTGAPASTTGGSGGGGGNSELRVAVYWGQDSAGSTYPSNQSKWEQGLAAYCQDDTYDIIIMGFVDLFPTAPSSLYPGLNFANHCGDYYDSSDPYLLMCSQIGSDIQYCQSQGKIIELSFGGAAGSYGFSSDTQAQQFAGMVWNMFMGGNNASIPRPFGTAKIDGIDLDIEGGSLGGYGAFINQLRTYYATDASKQYYISGAPQCPYPDAYLGPTGTTALQISHFDFVFVQFYNNYCGLSAFGTSNWNFATWANWAANVSVNAGAKLFIGAPASPAAAGTGYLSVSSMESVIQQTYSQFPNQFGGIMLWDASQAQDNGQYGTQIKNYMKSLATITTGASTSTSSQGTTSSRTTGTTASPPTNSTSASGSGTTNGSPISTEAVVGTGSGLTTGTIVGIVVGVMLALLLLVIFIALFVKRRQERMRSRSSTASSQDAMLDMKMLRPLSYVGRGKLEVGSKCVALYSGDEQPYSATITKSANIDGVNSYYVDYGPRFGHHGEWLPADKIRVWS